MTLVEIIKNETLSLKNEYLEKVATWAKEEFARCEEKASWTEAQWCNRFGIQPEERKNFKGETQLRLPSGFYNTKLSRIYSKEKYGAQRVVALGKDFVATAVSEAELHYENSIEKLAYRVQSKNLNVNSLTVKHSKIGINLDCVISDGEKSVRAFTIIASGPIQKPHYRFLIK